MFFFAIQVMREILLILGIQVSIGEMEAMKEVIEDQKFKMALLIKK